MFADNIEARFRQQVVDVADAAGQRILDRQQRISGAAFGNGRDRIFEGRAGKRRHVGESLAGRDMRVRARLTLKGDGVFR